MKARTGRLAEENKKQMEKCRKWNLRHPVVGGLQGDIMWLFLYRLLTDPRLYRKFRTEMP